MSDTCLLVGDIGGTNARFALASSARPGFTEAKTLQCADYSTANAAIEEYLGLIHADAPVAICLAAAGPVVDNTVRFTNNHWVIDGAELERVFSTRRVTLLNDFEAVACALPLLHEHDRLPLGGPAIQPLADRDFTVAAVGAGTGLGAAGLMQRNGERLPLIGEVGNSGFSAETDLQAELQAFLRAREGHVPVEHLVSGPGIQNIYRALAHIHGIAASTPSTADIFLTGLGREESLATEAVDLFFEMLGQVAGDIALTLGAWDGIYIAGGVVARYPDALAGSQFRHGFENKGDYRELMQRIPTVLVTLPEPGLLGASDCALRLLNGSPNETSRGALRGR